MSTSVEDGTTHSIKKTTDAARKSFHRKTSRPLLTATPIVPIEGDWNLRSGSESVTIAALGTMETQHPHHLAIFLGVLEIMDDEMSTLLSAESALEAVLTLWSVRPNRPTLVPHLTGSTRRDLWRADRVDCLRDLGRGLLSFNIEMSEDTASPAGQAERIMIAILGAVPAADTGPLAATDEGTATKNFGLDMETILPLLVTVEGGTMAKRKVWEV
ncbi:hypothetical protein M427DRAFT_35920 [Gonapodya prolifera JEL478]|uniref:Uncharacterized protein n=1 Tax=Gonapodya prolifera (strain JEL478) TaxID=1344416 RepID=A0A139A3Z0_GONPJ|nr:hypothetical protein M427DRAFT_35920 [Gonapodya prolifera JEL478]|eukprot:KXS11389.1 hypothetical protein M427DRAFT_35920 [Gonapodya prolifera JEL478]